MIDKRLPKDWLKKNRRRAELIRKNEYGTLAPEETEELKELQAWSAAIVKEIDPLPTEPIMDMLVWLKNHQNEKGPR